MRQCGQEVTWDIDSLTQELIIAQIVTIADKRLLIIIEKKINILI